MAISATQIATTNTLENFRQQFNNLQTDVNGLESGTLTFSSVSATTTSTSALNILEDGTIVFEGATDSTNETTLTVADPTADRTITLPDATGTVFLTGTTDTAIFSDKTALASADVAGGTDVLLIADISATTIKKITPDNLISSAGGLTSLAGDSTPQLGGDLDMNSQSIVTTSNADINLTPNGTGDVVLGADTVKVGDSGAAATLTSNGAGTLTVTTGGATDLVLNTNAGTNSSSITITDAANGNISAALNGTAVFQIDGSDGVEIEQGAISIKNGGSESYVRFYCESSNAHYTQLQASPHSAYSGNVTVVLPAAATNLVGDDTTQTLTNKTITSASVNTALLPASADGATLGSASAEFSDLFLADGATIQFGNDQEITLTHVADTGLTLTHTASGDDKPIVLNLKSEEDDLASGEEIGRIDFTAGDSGGTDAITTAASIAAVAEDTFASDNNSTGLAFKLGVSAAATEMFRMDHDGDFKVLTDGSAIAFGANNEIELTHVHDTGLLLTDSGGTPTLQFHDANEAVSSDGSKLILTSGGTAFSLPTSDGSSGQFLKTNGSAVLSFDTVSSAADDITAGDAAINITTTSGNITIDAAANDSDVIIKGTDATADITMATFDGSDAGTLILNHDLELGTDGSLIKFGTDNEITLTHVADTGLLLADSGGSPTLQFHDSAESVSSDGSKLILTSNSVAFNLPTADGSNGQFLKTDGSGALSFGTVSTTGAFTAFEYTATAAQTSFSGNDDNSNSLSYTSGVNNVFVTVNGVMLDGSDYTATNGTAVVLSAAANANDIVKILATNASSVTTTDLDGSEFVLDADGDTTLHADTDDQIDIKIAGADDFRFTANNFNVLSGSTLTIDSGATITNSGTASGFGLSTGKAIVLAMLFGR